MIRNTLSCYAISLAASIFLNTVSHAEEEITLKATIQNSAPKYILAQQVSGVCTDIYRELQTKLKEHAINLLIPEKATPIKRILAEVKAGHADIYCGAGRNTLRENNYIYSRQPVYYASNVLVAHQDSDLHFKDIEALRNSGIEIIALFGTSSAKWLKSLGGIKVDDSILDMNQALAIVASGRRGKLFFYHDFGAQYVINKKGLPLQLLPIKFRTVPQWIIYSKKTHPSAVERAELELEKMHAAGIIAGILKKYGVN